MFYAIFLAKALNRQTMITTIDEKSALILIDFQYLNTRRELIHPALEILTNAARLGKAFRRNDQLVIVVNVIPTGAAWTKTRKEPQPEQTTSGPDAFEIDERLNADPGDLFLTKKSWNAFFDTGLHEHLKARGITGVILAGLSTRIGVEGTARSALECGYNVTFAVDAMSDTSLESHTNCLTHIFPRIGELGTVEEIIGKLQLKNVLF